MLGMFVLITFWLGGSALVQWLGWPIPGSVVGLLALWIALVLHGGVPAWLKQPSSLLIRYLTLLFVPAGVGLVEHWDTLMHQGLAMLAVIAASTLLAALAMIAIFKTVKGGR